MRWFVSALLLLALGVGAVAEMGTSFLEETVDASVFAKT